MHNRVAETTGMTFWRILLAFVAITAVSWFWYKRRNLFQKLGVLHKARVPIFGNMLPLFLGKLNFIDVIQQVYDLHPDAKYVGFYDFTTPVFLIRDEELIKSIAIKNFDHFVDHRGLQLVNEPIFENSLFGLRDKKWRKVRSILTPVFTSNKVKSAFRSMSNRAREYADHLRKNLSPQITIDSRDLFTRFAIDVIAMHAFGFEIDSIGEPDNPFYSHAREVTNFGNFRLILNLFLKKTFPNFSKFLGLKIFADDQVEYFRRVIGNSIEEREETGVRRPDMIQLMLDSREKGGDFLTIEEMTAQAFVFLLAGVDTTSSLICMTAHLLAVHPEVQEKLHREIDEVLGTLDFNVEFENLREFAYLDAVIHEVNRLYPPAPYFDRMCVKDFPLPGALPDSKPVVLKKGSCVWFPVYALHRDSKNFENPEKFQPERFTGLNETRRLPSAYMPFGIGPRACIATNFAQTEIKILLIHILSRCEFVPCPKTEYPFKLMTRGLSIVPEKGFWVAVKSRGRKIP